MDRLSVVGAVSQRGVSRRLAVIAEGNARDVVRAVQDLRKERRLEFTDRIEIGLVADSEELKAAVKEFVAYIQSETLATKPAAALAAIRRTITLGGGMSFEDGMTLELETATARADTADFAEGVDAFLHKRAPQWAPR